MGMFSWFTQDTNHRIVAGEKFRIIMTDDKGNQFVEECYGGYGEFGGKDYYELLAEMNGREPDRNVGIDLAYGVSYNQDCEIVEKYSYGNNPNIKYPSLTESGKYMGGLPPEHDSNQGFKD